ncbi:ArsR/SmtB family transcription factor [Lacicoccus alkaliphilus]|uniref:Transcriptional regulator, ArsR family n=1 Tax=Lacicoccus alkaliphilus DSM 16010 TaxID=1123231 RepID=A0A1M7KQR3_9BACL|nr:helix-turn-helix domain-containing protein [Salinicoccus alkaliphilus]SHM67770.1 transcriptional regulator, ArsR family [Salinicoccus alkaliphilus DSM 16010]
MKKLLVINKLAQLKSVSDPFRIKLLALLSEKPKTGQMLADEIGIPRAKIHYHLNELLKNEIIHVVKTEEKNSIIQKFYEPVAEKVVPDISLLQYKQEKKKKDNMSYHLRIKEKELDQFKKNLKNFVKDHSTKKTGDKFSDYKIQILPFEEE